MSSANELDDDGRASRRQTIIAIPMIVMALGFGGMMGYGGMMGGGTMSGAGGGRCSGLLVPLLFLLGLLGGGYVLVRRLASDRPSRDAALEELRVAYARGDLPPTKSSKHAANDSNGRSETERTQRHPRSWSRNSPRNDSQTG